MLEDQKEEKDLEYCDFEELGLLFFLNVNLSGSLIFSKLLYNSNLFRIES